jgi:hypothetical protein
MFGLVQLVMSAERELRDKNMGVSDESSFAMYGWLWRHRRLFFGAGAMMLELLIVGVVGV